VALSHGSYLPSLSNIGRGIEREALRILPGGRLSDKPHYSSIGSALTHPQITTDYSETLLEFITPVSYSPEVAIAQLADIQKFTLGQIDGELLWPLSMPCFVGEEDDIALAQYGSSNIGTMKTVYRQGLKNRYGSMMQVISGIHFNFSFSDEFWQALQTISDTDQRLDEFISTRYFSLIRNYTRYSWLIPYLFGSSPAICGSFLQDKPQSLPFKKSAKGYLYLKYATSLRMSDLGYTNSDQSSLHVCYNDLDGYVAGVKQAMTLASTEFNEIGVKVDGKYQQLNANVLQIENELYAPIRPKRVAKSGEKPSEALASRGVEYIEVRALDLNPFTETGISVEQIYFLDVFLTYCALLPSSSLDEKTQSAFEANMGEVVIRGRDPDLMLNDLGQDKSVVQWGGEIFAGLRQVATLLDKANDSTKYQQSIAAEFAKINDANLTPSAKLLDLVVNKELSLTELALEYAKKYRDKHHDAAYQSYSEQDFIDSVKQSHQAQTAIEQADTLSFDEFLNQYFSE
jgi:glutamate--cysteine ligase